MHYILASASPRRRELLSRILTDFEIIPATGKETAPLNASDSEVACALAEHKCDEVFARYPDNAVIGCDTIVVFNGEILGKPKDADDARRTLKMLSGNTHSVITGVCVRRGEKKIIKSCKTDVTFNLLTDEFIDSYVKGGSPLDKAGSYGIQDGGVVESYVGSYTNVVGLPLSLVKNMLDELNEKC